MTEAVVVVGAGLAGGRTCEALVLGGYPGPVILLGAESHPPYDRPPLSKAVLAGADDAADLGIDLNGVDVRLGVSALDLDRSARVVETDAGPISYRHLVIATGAEPIRLPGDGVQVALRTREDALAIRAGLQPGARVVIVGAGWIGAEVATAALAAGALVTCLEGGAAPLSGPLGEAVASRMVPWWSQVDLRTGVTVTAVEPDGVRLGDGTVLPADLVVVGVGVRPATGWLAAAGLELVGRAVAVDQDGRTSDPAIFAVGDAAARYSARLEGRVHGGHWDEAINGAGAVAAAILGGPGRDDAVPYFWSDQFGRKVQYVGQHHPSDRVVLRETDDPAKWGAAWVDSEGRLTAHLNVGYPRSMVLARTAIEQGRTVELAALAQLSAPL